MTSKNILVGDLVEKVGHSYVGEKGLVYDIVVNSNGWGFVLVLCLNGQKRTWYLENVEKLNDKVD